MNIIARRENPITALRRDVFDQLHEYKRDNRLLTCEQVVEGLLPAEVAEEATA